MAYSGFLRMNRKRSVKLQPYNQNNERKDVKTHRRGEESCTGIFCVIVKSTTFHNTCHQLMSYNINKILSAALNQTIKANSIATGRNEPIARIMN